MSTIPLGTIKKFGTKYYILKECCIIDLCCTKEIHQEADRKRIEKEEKINYENKLIESALNKLTEEEKRVLKKMYSSGKD